MADFGDKLPVPINREVKETKEMRKLWLDSQIKELEARISAKKRELLHLETLLTQTKQGFEMLEKSIDAEIVK
jgi:hypothetical protein